MIEYAGKHLIKPSTEYARILNLSDAVLNKLTVQISKLLLRQSMEIISPWAETHSEHCQTFNPLSANPTKWPNALKEFVGNLPTKVNGFQCKAVATKSSILDISGVVEIPLINS